jgi:predicted kinase
VNLSFAGYIFFIPARLLAMPVICYKPDMRNWMRERMKRRAKKQPNESESTGKVGQELPELDPAQPAPLRPSYEAGERPAGRVKDRRDQSAANFSRSAQVEGRMEEETQPDQPSTPPAPPDAALSASPAEPGAQKPRAPKGVVVLAIGLPGSGKTTWFKRRGVTPLSSDMLRTLLFDDITEQRYQGLVFSTLRSLLRARLIAKMPWNYVDATNLSPHERRQWIKMSRSFGYEVHAVFFDVPLEVCLERNRRRERSVQEEVLKKMAEKLRPPSFKEGFSKIVVVRVKKPE